MKFKNYETDEITKLLKIEAIVKPIEDIQEELPSGNQNEIYDEQTLEEWYNFASTVEGIIDNFCDVINVSLSKHADSLSEYIDFYSYDKDGNRKNYLIDLRLSDHRSTYNSRSNRIRKVKRLNTNYELIGVVVNNKTFKTYSDAIKYIRKILTKYLVENDGDDNE